MDGNTVVTGTFLNLDGFNKAALSITFGGGILMIKFEPEFEVTVREGVTMNEAAELFVETLRKLYGKV